MLNRAGIADHRPANAEVRLVFGHDAALAHLRCSEYRADELVALVFCELFVVVEGVGVHD